MNIEYWQGIQSEILERRGIYKLWVFLFLFCGTVIMLPEIPVLAYSPQLFLGVITLVFLGIIWHVCKEERSKEQSHELLGYMVLFLVMIAGSISSISACNSQIRRMVCRSSSNFAGITEPIDCLAASRISMALSRP